MKITKSQLKQIIKEELTSALEEPGLDSDPAGALFTREEYEKITSWAIDLQNQTDNKILSTLKKHSGRETVPINVHIKGEVYNLPTIIEDVTLGYDREPIFVVTYEHPITGKRNRREIGEYELGRDDDKESFMASWSDEEI